MTVVDPGFAEKKVEIGLRDEINMEMYKSKVCAVTRSEVMFSWLTFQEDNLNYEDGASPLKKFKERMAPPS